MAIKFTNNASSKLTQALTADATSMQIKAEDVSKFPVLGAGDYCLLTLVGDNSNHEIVKVTNISSDGICTIERAQDSTTAKEWPIDNRVELRITAEYLNNTADAKVVEEIINTTIPSLPDDITISFKDDKLQVKDIAIGGDSSDLASNRGFFECVNVGDFDYNNLTTQGFYSVNKSGSTNGPGFAARVFVLRPKNSYYATQVAFSLTGPSIAVRGNTSAENTWSKWVYYINTTSVGDGIKVTNNKISVPEYEGATSSSAATSGLVPPATSAERNNFLRGDGTWQQVDLSDYALKTELSKYLPLTGGELSDDLKIRSNDFFIGPENKLHTQLRSYNGKFYILVSDAGIDTYNSLRPFTINLTTGLVKFGTSAQAITPSSSSNDTTIPTTEWVNDKLANYLPITGTAAKATILATSRTIRTNLASTSAASFNGSANITPGVTGILPVANGGTGSDTEKYIKLSSISNSVTSTSTRTVASSSAVKQAYDKAVEAESKTGLPLGHIFMWPFSTPPSGSLIVNGSTYSRTTYADLWNYINSHRDWVKTESEWQSIASANGGYCPYYSSGNGSSTFRVPKFAPYQQIAISSGNAGTYHEAGLPDVQVGFNIHGFNNSSYTSALYNLSGALKETGHDTSPPSDHKVAIRGIDQYVGGRSYNMQLSYGSNKYGKSSTVQPESTEWVLCVVAYGSATNIGSVDVSNVLSAVEQVQANPNLQGTAHITKTWKSGSSWYRKWSDNFIEQGGIYTATSGDGKKTINLNTPFSNTNYVVLFTKYRGYTADGSTSHQYVLASSSQLLGSDSVSDDNRTVSGFNTYMYSSAKLVWYACGY